MAGENPVEPFQKLEFRRRFRPKSVIKAAARNPEPRAAPRVRFPHGTNPWAEGPPDSGGTWFHALRVGNAGDQQERRPACARRIAGPGAARAAGDYPARLSADSAAAVSIIVAPINIDNIRNSRPVPD